jgi:hypothetical protein
MYIDNFSDPQTICHQENLLCRENCKIFPFQTVKMFFLQKYEEKLVGVSQNFQEVWRTQDYLMGALTEEQGRRENGGFTRAPVKF